MPLRVYTCKECNHNFEVLEPKEPRPTKCSECGCIHLINKIGATSFRLLGDGKNRPESKSL